MSEPYPPGSRDRIVAEPAKQEGDHGRSPFERDRARVLHSAALRRLAAKTQVVTAGEADFPRTRLTHSLEVAQIGRELGAALGCDPDVVDTAGLAHDLGHPPFGHNGEYALDELAVACGGFEGNAQTLRVLTRLEAKVFDARGVSVGLNLTRAVLDACVKYPWERGADPDGTVKFGVYADDRVAFDWLRRGVPGVRRCLEAQVMDWADDVAYSVHDIEDGVQAGHIHFGRLADADERRALCAQVSGLYSPSEPDILADTLATMLAGSEFATLAAYDGSHRATAAVKGWASATVGRFTAAAVRATREAFGAGPSRRYAADLVVPDRVREECALLKGVAWRYVMHRPGAAARYARQREVVGEVVTVLCRTAPATLDPVFRPLWMEAVDDAARLRVVVDQVASLTDRSILAWRRRLRQARA